jgi:rhodanese-related sulfurtransferase
MVAKGPGQMQLNLDFVEVAEKVIPRAKKLVVGCMAGGRSQRACEMLEEAGFTDLTNVVGGFGGQRDASGKVVVAGWKDAGLPVTTELGDAAYAAQRAKAGV